MPTLNRWQRLLLALLILMCLLPPALIKWGAPLAVRMAFNQFIEDNNLEGTAPVLDIALLDRRISLSGLRLARPDGTDVLRIPSMSVALDPGALMERTLHITDLSLTGAWLDVVQQGDQWHIAGHPLPGGAPVDTNESSTEPWGLRVDRARLSDNRVHLTRAGASATLSLGQLDLDRVRVLGDRISLAARLRAQINQNSTLALTAEVVTEPALFVHANIEQSDIHREDLATLATLPVELGNARLRVSGDLRYTGGALPKVELGQARAELSRLSAKVDDLNLTTESAELDNLVLSLELPENQPPALMASAAVTVAPLQVEGDQGQWLGWQRLEIPALHVSGPATPDIRAASVHLTDLLLSRVRQPGDAPDAPPLFQTKGLTLKDVLATDTSLRISEVNLAGAQGLIALDSSGQLTTLIPFRPSEPTANTSNPAITSATAPGPGMANDGIQANEGASTVAPVSAAATPFTLQIDTLTLDNASSLQFRDGGVQLPFERTLFFQNLRLTGLQNRDVAKPAHLDTVFATDAGARLAIQADLTPFAQLPGFSVQMQGQQIALPRFSTYLEQALGYHIESGDLDTQVTLSGNADAFKGTATLKMTRMDLKGLPGQTRSEATAIPLDLALDQLKEGDGVIELDIPFEHNAGKSDIGLGSFVGLIMKKALYQAAKTYLVNTFVPYANVVSVVALAGDQLFKLRFEPLPYAPGQLLPQRPQMDYLAAMKAVLEKRPAPLKLCPVALPEEADTLTLADIGKLPEDLRKLPAVRVLAEKLKAGARGAPLALAFAEARASIFRYMARFSGLSGKTFISCGAVVDARFGQPVLAFSVD